MDRPVVTPPSVAIRDTDARFPVRRILCVGQNYAAHAAEMGNTERKPPFFFSKPADAAVAPDRVPYPPRTADLHHEVELVVALGAGGRDLDPAAAAALVWGHGIGIDLTRRDVQAEAKAAGRPWDMAKGFDASAPVGPLVPGAPPSRGAIALSVNGEERQRGDLSDMIWSVPEILAELSRWIALAPGDLIFTGTPSGVGPVRRGDTLVATVDGLKPLTVAII